MKRFASFICIILVFANFASSQACYNFISEQSGISLASYQEPLDEAACNLIYKFPYEYQDSFGIYDIGFYRFSDIYTDGLIPFKDIARDRISAQTPYYLVFGRELNSGGEFKKYWINIKLPYSDEFECIDLISAAFRKELPLKLEVLAVENFNYSNYTEYDFYNSTVIVLDYLINLIEEIVECCDPSEGLREYSEQCISPCMFSPSQQLSILKDRGFYFEFAYVVNDPDYNDNNSITVEPQERSIQLPMDITLDYGDGGIESLDWLIEELINEHTTDLAIRLGISADVSLYTYKYPRDCGYFETIWENYVSDGADLKIFVCAVNWDNEFCVLGVHVEANNVADNFNSSSDRSSSDILKDELDGISQVYNDHGESCWNLTFASASYSGAVYYLGQDKYQFRSAEDMRRAIDLYSDAQVDINIAWYDFNIYWIKENKALTLKYSTENCLWACSFKARIQTSWNLCSGTIHTLLDICGLEPTVFGIVCDGTNAVLYLVSNDLTNAALSAASVVPIAGYAKNGVKYAGKLWKPIHHIGNDFVENFAFKTTYTGLVDWTLKSEGVLRNTIINYNIKYVFNGVEVVYDATKHNAHHLVPMQLARLDGQHVIMKKLAKLGWHPNNPTINGYVIPIKLPNGKTFHCSHFEYNRWVDDALIKLDKIPESQLLDKMNELNNKLIQEIQFFYTQNISLNQHFKNLKKF